MAMGPAEGQEATRQVEIVCLDELVPEDDLYRRIDALVDWGFVRAVTAPYYADAVGRPSVDPVVLLKLMLAGALEGIGSMRELLRVAARDLSIRRFLGYGLGERLPGSPDRLRRPLQPLPRCESVRAGVPAHGRAVRRARLARRHPSLGRRLPRGCGRSAQGLRASLVLAPAPAPAGSASGEELPAPLAPQLSLAEPHSGPTPKRASVTVHLAGADSRTSRTTSGSTATGTATRTTSAPRRASASEPAGTTAPRSAATSSARSSSQPATCGKPARREARPAEAPMSPVPTTASRMTGRPSSGPH